VILGEGVESRETKQKTYLGNSTDAGWSCSGGVSGRRRRSFGNGKVPDLIDFVVEGCVSDGSNSQLSAGNNLFLSWATILIACNIQPQFLRIIVHLVINLQGILGTAACLEGPEMANIHRDENLPGREARGVDDFSCFKSIDANSIIRATPGNLARCNCNWCCNGCIGGSCNRCIGGSGNWSSDWSIGGSCDGSIGRSGNWCIK